MFDALFSIFFSVSILVYFRLLKPAEGKILQVITVNYLTAFVLGALTSDAPIKYISSETPAWLGIASILGLLFIATFFLFALSSRKAGITLTAVASRMSVLIPVTGGLVIFGESLSLTKWIGLAMVFPAFYYSLYKKSEEYRFDLKNAILPLTLLLGTGMNDLLMNYVSRKYSPVDLPFMLAIIFGLAFIVGSSTLIYNVIKNKTSLRLSSLPLGILLGLINYASTYFLLKAMVQIDATVLFPFVNASIVLLAAMVDVLVFGHRLGGHQLAGMALALMAILLITG